VNQNLFLLQRLHDSMLVGIDEAGRGPVIGPLVVCGAALSEESLPELESLNLKDSKKYTRKKREELLSREVYIKEILTQGKNRAQVIAQSTMAEVKKKMGLL